MTIKIHRFGELDSTSSEAIRMARAGEPEGAVIVADRQTAGRGREGRRWESPAGKNLYVSFLLRPTVTAKDAHEIRGEIARVVKDLLKEKGEFAIKPPNDILLDGKKVAGILCEMSSQGEKAGWVVVGIGLNVNAGPEDFSPEVRETATSLKVAFGTEFDREEMLCDLVAAMERWYENFRR